MNPIDIIEQDNKNSITERLAIDAFNRGYLCALLHHANITLSDTAFINAYGSSVWFTINNRDDLQSLLELAPRWTKEGNGASLTYKAKVHDRVDVLIQAHEGALPSTCRLVEVTEEVPARKVTRMVVQCDQPAADESLSPTTP